MTEYLAFWVALMDAEDDHLDLEYHDADGNVGLVDEVLS